MIKKIVFFWSISILSLAQNQLPLANGFLEDIENNEFQYWSHQANEGGDKHTQLKQII